MIHKEELRFGHALRFEPIPSRTVRNPVAPVGYHVTKFFLQPSPHLVGIMAAQYGFQRIVQGFGVDTYGHTLASMVLLYAIPATMSKA